MSRGSVGPQESPGVPPPEFFGVEAAAAFQGPRTKQKEGLQEKQKKNNGITNLFLNKSALYYIYVCILHYLYFTFHFLVFKVYN